METELGEIKEQIKDISFVAYEASQHRSERERKCLIISYTIIIAVLLLYIAASTIIGISYFLSMQKVTETTTTEEITTYEGIEQSTENGGNNVVGGDISG
jgi:hypothetical protein